MDKIFNTSINYFPLNVFLAKLSASNSNFLEKRLNIKEINSDMGENKIEKQSIPVWKFDSSIPSDKEKIGKKIKMDSR